MPNALTILNREVIACRLCPRLVAYREQIASEKPRAFPRPRDRVASTPQDHPRPGSHCLRGLSQLPQAPGLDRRQEGFSVRTWCRILHFRRTHSAGFVSSFEPKHPDGNADAGHVLESHPAHRTALDTIRLDEIGGYLQISGRSRASPMKQMWRGMLGRLRKTAEEREWPSVRSAPRC